MRHYVYFFQRLNFADTEMQSSPVEEADVLVMGQGSESQLATAALGELNAERECTNEILGMFNLDI